MPAVDRVAVPVANAREEGLRAREVRDMPDPPLNYWRLVGPGIVAGGVGLSSGEFVLWPFIASQVGLILLWGPLVGVVTQFFLNMEVERYTLATGETAVTGFNRFWKHWGLVFAILVYCANLWPGWAISSATLASYLLGGNPSGHRILADLRAGNLRGARAPDLRQGCSGAYSSDPRSHVCGRSRVVARIARRDAELRQDSGRAQHRVNLRCHCVCRIRRRTESVSKQLDSR